MRIEEKRQLDRDVRRSDFRQSDWQCGLRRMLSFTADCMVAGDFSTLLEMTGAGEV